MVAVLVTREIQLLPVVVTDRPTDPTVYRDVPAELLPHLRIVRAGEVERGDLVLGDTDQPTKGGAGLRWSGYWCAPFEAAPREHDRTACVDCRDVVDPSELDDPRPESEIPAVLRRYRDQQRRRWVETAAHRDGGVIDLQEGGHAHYGVDELLVVIPAAYRWKAPSRHPGDRRLLPGVTVRPVPRHDGATYELFEGGWRTGTYRTARALNRALDRAIRKALDRMCHTSRPTR
ncbi:hypothetical protein ACWCV5_27995 [Streptomyces tubercidicus]